MIKAFALSTVLAVSGLPIFYSKDGWFGSYMPDSSSTPGDVTQNAIRGRAAIANGASCVTFTNALYKGSSTQVFAQARTTSVGANLRYLYVIHQSSTSFSVCSNTATSATLVFDWKIIP